MVALKLCRDSSEGSFSLSTGRAEDPQLPMTEGGDAGRGRRSVATLTDGTA